MIYNLVIYELQILVITLYILSFPLILLETEEVGTHPFVKTSAAMIQMFPNFLTFTRIVLGKGY